MLDMVVNDLLYLFQKIRFFLLKKLLFSLQCRFICVFCVFRVTFEVLYRDVNLVANKLLASINEIF